MNFMIYEFYLWQIRVLLLLFILNHLAQAIKEQAVEIFEEAENQKQEISNGQYLAKSNEAQQLYNEARRIESISYSV